jgi:hypothetical protein
MRRLLLVLAVTFGAYQIAETCGPWFVLRASLNPTFWQPLARSIPDLLGPPTPSRKPVIYAGMRAGGAGDLAAARQAYRVVARWREEGFTPWEPQGEPTLSMVVTTARAAVVRARGSSPRDAEELDLIACKITLREAEALRTVSGTKFATPPTAPLDTLNRAAAQLRVFLAKAKDPALLSEARGWLARCHFLLGEPHAAARIYLDELGSPGSALSRETLLASLRVLFPYDGSDAHLADHIEDYFDTPEHALFAVSLVTNPPDEGAPPDTAAARRALAALRRHPDLFASAPRALTIASMRAALQVGEPGTVIDLAAALSANGGLRGDREVRWMVATSHALRGEYAAAEPDLTSLVEDPSVKSEGRVMAGLGLLAVYQKMGRGRDQLVRALRLASEPAFDEWYEDREDSFWTGVSWPYVGWLMDLSYLLDVQSTDEDLNAARLELAGSVPVTIEPWGLSRKMSAVQLIDYARAVRAARREDYPLARDLYARVGVVRRARRMQEAGRLYGAARGAGANFETRYAYAAFLAANPDRLFFNDSLWAGFQTSAFLLTPDREFGPDPSFLTTPERDALKRAEREVKDLQEERWRAYQLLEALAHDAAGTPMARKATLAALECLARINIERFGREAEIATARKRLTASLRRSPAAD